MNLKKIYKEALNEYVEGAIGYSAIAIIAQSALGSIAVMLINMNGNSIFNVIEFMLVTIFCMTYNATVLSQQKPAFAFKVLTVSVIFSFLMIVYNIIII